MTITGKETYFLQPEFPVEIYIPIDIDLYKEAVKSPSRKWRVTVEVDFPEGTYKFEEDEIVNFSLLREASGRGDNPLGFITSNEFVLALDNHDRRFSPFNTAKEYTIRPGLEVRPYLILELPGPDATIPLGTYWTSDWDTNSTSIEAITTCHDRLMDIISLDTPQIPPMIDTSVSEMFGRLFRALGLGIDEYIVSSSLTQPVKVGWFERDTVGNSLQKLAEAGNCFVSVDRQNRIIVQPNIRTSDPVAEYTDEDMIFSVNNPQQVLDIFTAIKMQYRVPYQKERSVNLVRADNILIPPGETTLDRVDFHSADIPVLEVTRVYIYGRDIAQETWDLYLGGADGGTFTLGDGTTNTDPMAHNINNTGIQGELEDIFGAGEVVVTGAAGDFEIVFSLNVGESGLRASFTSLANAVNPYILRRRGYVGPVLSEVRSLSWGATDIILNIENETELTEEIDIQVEGIGTGHHIGHSVISDAEAVNNYGHKELALENHLIQAQQVAANYSEILLGYVSDPLAWFEISFRGDPILDVGDIITIESAADKVEPTDIMVKRITLEYDGGLTSTIRGRRAL